MIDEKVIAALRDALGDDGTIVRQLIDLYATDSAALLAKAESALETRAAESLKRAAHSLKSTSASMGAMAAAEAARELEDCVKDSDLAQAAPALQRLTLAVNAAVAELARMRFGA